MNKHKRNRITDREKQVAAKGERGGKMSEVGEGD